MNPLFSSEDAELEKMLARPESPLPDDGFSLRVLAALPAPALRSLGLVAPQPRRSRANASNKLRAIFCFAGALVGVFVSWYYGWSSVETSTVTKQLSQAWSVVVSASSDPGRITMGVVAVGSILYAFFSDGRRNILDR